MSLLPGFISNERLTDMTAIEKTEREKEPSTNAITSNADAENGNGVKGMSIQIGQQQLTPKVAARLGALNCRRTEPAKEVVSFSLNMAQPAHSEVPFI